MARKTVGVIGFVRGKPVSSEQEIAAAQEEDSKRDLLRLCGVYRSVRPVPVCFGIEEAEGAKPPLPPAGGLRAKKVSTGVPLLAVGTVVDVGLGLTEGKYIARRQDTGEIVCLLNYRMLYEDFERVE